MRTGRSLPLLLALLADGLAGVALEVLSRGAAPDTSTPCGADFQLLRVGARELPLAREDHAVPSVRLALAQLTDAFLGSRHAETVDTAVRVLLRAHRARALATGTVEGLRAIFPTRSFGAEPLEGLRFQPLTGPRASRWSPR